MQLRSLGGGNSVMIRPKGYQFSRLGDRFDDDWVHVSGRVIDLRGEWAFLAPCLLASELPVIGAWLARVADGRETVTAPDADGTVEPSLSFLEPCLAWSRAPDEGTSRVVRAHFSLEAAPPWAEDEQQEVTHQVWVELVVLPDQLVAAAAQWAHECRQLPVR